MTLLTLARYVPAIDFPAWLRSAASGSKTVTDAREQNIAELGGGRRWETVIEFANGRGAMRSYFSALAESRRGVVLMPAQICSAAIEAVRLTGLSVRFVDGDGSYPTPSAHQYAAAMSKDVVGIVVAPLYGFLQSDWAPLLSRLGDQKLMLDFAQGLTLADAKSELLGRADAIVYSFGLGKGIDTGGGLLLARDGVVASGASSSASAIGTLLKAIALRVAIASGAYGALIERMERASEAGKVDAASFEPRRIGTGLHQLWRDKIRRFREEVAVASRRSQLIRESSKVRDVTRDLDVYTSSEAVRLRQVLRFRTAELRDGVAVRLRRNGVDCAPAGEPVPEGDFPNARKFIGDAIRLPFLGRLSEKQFGAFQRALESAIDEHLSH